ncbi:MAG: hypothetical protein ACKVU4_13110 [Phycisphaerales bacterium]
MASNRNSRRSGGCTRATAAAVALAAGTAGSLGQPVTWTGTQGPSWHDQQNWDPQGVPGPNADAILPATASGATITSLVEINSIDCSSSLALNYALVVASASRVENLTFGIGVLGAGGPFTIDGQSILGYSCVVRGTGPFVNIGYLTASGDHPTIQATEFRNQGTLRLQGNLGMSGSGGIPAVLKNSSEMWLESGTLSAGGDGSHILNQGTLFKMTPTTVTVGGGDANTPGFIHESGSVAVQAGTLYFGGHTRWTGGAVSISSGAMLHLYAGGGGPHVFDGLPSISGTGVLLVEPAFPGFSGGPVVYADDITLQMAAPGRAVWGGSSHRVGDATLTNNGLVEWPTGGFSKVTPQSQALIRNEETITIPTSSSGVSTGVDLINQYRLHMYSSLGLLDGATLTNDLNGVVYMRRGEINGSQATRILNHGEISRPPDSLPEFSSITAPLDMDGGALHLVNGGPPEANLAVWGGGVWKNGAELIANAAAGGGARILNIPAGEYTIQGAGNRFHGSGIVSTQPMAFMTYPTITVAGGGHLDLDMGGVFLHKSGNLGGPGTIRNLGRLTLAGGAIGVQGQANLENYAITAINEATSIAGTVVNRGVAFQFGSVTLDGAIRNEGTTPGAGNWQARTLPGQSISGAPGAVFHNEAAFELESLSVPQDFALDVSVRFNNTALVSSHGILRFQGTVDQLQDGVLTGGTWRVAHPDARIIFPAAITKIGASAVVEGGPEQVPQIAGLVEVAGVLNVESIASFPNLSSITGSGRINFPDGSTLTAQQGLGVGILGSIAGGRTIQESVPEAFLITPLLTSNGRVIPGAEDGAAIIDLTGAYQQNATGRLEIEIGGLTPGMQHDVFEVSGQASLAGTLRVALIDGFVPSIGDEFTILTAGSLAGTFGTLDLPALPAGRVWEVLYAAGGEQWVVIRVTGPCYPDCNVSGTLTVADFGCFQSKYVLGDPYADCNGSGNLTVADFGCFQGKYVVGCP